MGIVQKTTDKEIQSEIERQRKVLENGIITILNYVGLQFMTEARDSLKIDTGAFPSLHKMTKKEMAEGGSQPKTGDYMDQTGNLRGSIGYFIFKDGIQVRGKVSGNFESTASAMVMLNSVPKITGFQLIGVAGMDYASYVESQGFNVITSQAAVAMVSLDTKLQAYANRKGMDSVNIETIVSSSLR
jgi:hypothetical protein